MEPIMKMEVVTPEDYMGDIVGDLNRRRGQVNDMSDRQQRESDQGKCAVVRNVWLRDYVTYVQRLVVQLLPWSSRTMLKRQAIFLRK